MKSNRLKSGNKLSVKDKQVLEQHQNLHKENQMAEQIVQEVLLLNNFDPNKGLNEGFEKASLTDFMNYSSS